MSPSSSHQPYRMPAVSQSMKGEEDWFIQYKYRALALMRVLVKEHGVFFLLCHVTQHSEEEGSEFCDCVCPAGLLRMELTKRQWNWHYRAWQTALHSLYDAHARPEMPSLESLIIQNPSFLVLVYSLLRVNQAMRRVTLQHRLQPPKEALHWRETPYAVFHTNQGLLANVYPPSSMMLRCLWRSKSCVLRFLQQALAFMDMNGYTSEFVPILFTADEATDL